MKVVLVLFGNQQTTDTTMVSTKVIKALESEILEEKKAAMEQLKEFLREKIDGDFDQISDFIDEFMTEKLSKTTSKKKEKKDRKPTFYNTFMKVGNSDIKKIEDQKEDDDEKIPRAFRMKLAAMGWNYYKESDNYESDLAVWKTEEVETDEITGLITDGWNKYISKQYDVDLKFLYEKKKKKEDEENSTSESDGNTGNSDESDDEIVVTKEEKKKKEKEAKEAKKKKEKEEKEAKKKKEKEEKEAKKEKEQHDSDSEDESSGNLLTIVTADSSDDED